MRDERAIRPERTLERFSRGAELCKAINRMWDRNNLLPREVEGVNQIINARIKAIVDEFDLTVAEWHYWCREARS